VNHSETVLENARRCTQRVLQGFDHFQQQFREITLRSKSRFINHDWHGIQADAIERLRLYTDSVRQCLERIRQDESVDLLNRSAWFLSKRAYHRLVENRQDIEIAFTFFNSVLRKVFPTIGINKRIEFTDQDFQKASPGTPRPVHQSYQGRLDILLFKKILHDFGLEVPFADLDTDLLSIIASLQEVLKLKNDTEGYFRVDIIRSLFYRNKGAYIIGRISLKDEKIPLLLPLLYTESGLIIDTALLTSDEVSIVFSFTRSYFHVEIENPSELIKFLKSIMPHKPISELYTAIGYNRHGKTELYRELVTHLEKTHEQFEIARGEKGMVMLVFSMPSFDVVFKVIKDSFDQPKSLTRLDVHSKYQMVFQHDRAGRLIDVQEFGYLKFEKSRFSKNLLEEFKTQAARTVSVKAGLVLIQHVYSERKLTPLNLYLKEVPEEKAVPVVLDFGYTIKELVAANIFPGDILLKNFGVTRHGRVVFYDYDELCLVTDCNFREFPQAAYEDDEYSAEPWFRVTENDIFPSELKTFLGLQGTLRDVFLKNHGDLFEVSFWHKIQASIRAGEIPNIFPYPEKKRFKHHKPFPL